MATNDASEASSKIAAMITPKAIAKPFQFTLRSLLPFVLSIALVASIYAYMGINNVPWGIAFVMWLIASFFFSLWASKRSWPLIVSILVFVLGALGLIATHPGTIFFLAWLAQLFILLAIPAVDKWLTRFATRRQIRWYAAVASLAIGFSIWMAFPNPEASWILRQRVEYPIADLSPMLAFEQRAVASPLVAMSKESIARLDQFEALLDDESDFERESLRLGPQMYWRTETLEQIHSSQYLRFVRTEGVGVSRMRPRDLGLWNEPLLAMTSVPNDGVSRSYSDRTMSLPWPQNADDAYSAQEMTIEVFREQRRLSLDKLHYFGTVDFVNPVGWGWSPEFQRAAGFVDHAFNVPPDRSLHEGITYTLATLQLVSLDRFDEPRAFVLEGPPSMDKISSDTVPTRALTDFELRGLTSLQSGEDIAVESSPPELFMVGAIRATKQCLQCHDAQRGELLGAFTYRLAAANSESPIADAK